MKPYPLYKPEQWTLICWLALVFILTGCGGQFHQVQFDAVPALQYESWTEKGYCMTDGGDVHNVQIGGAMSSPMPLCNRADIVMHTHPVWAERMANFLDYGVWEEYHKRYGNTLYGVSGDGWVKIYAIIGGE